MGDITDMTLIYKSILTVLSLILLAGCISKPPVAPEVTNQDASLSCRELLHEINQSKEYERVANEEDKFKLKYVLSSAAAPTDK